MKMRRSILARSVAAALASVAALVLTSGTAGATPPGLLDRGAPYTCGDNEIVVFGGNGRSGWIGDTLYVATEFHGVATFTPAEGEPETFRFDKTYGNGPAGEPIFCTQSFQEVSEEGIFAIEVMVYAVKVPGH